MGGEYDRIVVVCEEALRRAKNRVSQLIASGEAGKQEHRGYFGDISLVADLECERVIIETLNDKLGKVMFVTEERGIVNECENYDYIAVIDPVDGSNNLAAGIPFYSAAIAIAIGGDRFRDVIIGAAIDYTTGYIYHAVKDDNAYKDGAKIIHHNDGKAKTLKESYISLDPRIFKKTPVNAVNLVKNAKNIRFFGSSVLEILMVAEGKTDAFVAYPRIMRVVDFISPIFIADRAGAYVEVLERDLESVELVTMDRYGFIVASSRKLCGEILSTLNALTNNFAAE